MIPEGHGRISNQEQKGNNGLVGINELHTKLQVGSVHELVCWLNSFDVKDVKEYFLNPVNVAKCITCIQDNFEVLKYLLEYIRKISGEEEFYKLLDCHIHDMSLFSFLFFEVDEEKSYELLHFLRSLVQHEQLFLLLKEGIGAILTKFSGHSHIVSILRWLFQEYNRNEIDLLFSERDQHGSWPADWIFRSASSTEIIDVVTLVSEHVNAKYASQWFHCIRNVRLPELEQLLTTLSKWIGVEALYQECIVLDKRNDPQIDSIFTHYQHSDIPILLKIFQRVFGNDLLIKLLQSKDLINCSLFERCVLNVFLLKIDREVLKEVLHILGACMDGEKFFEMCSALCTLSRESMTSILANMHPLDILYVVSNCKYRDDFLWKLIKLQRGTKQENYLLLDELNITGDIIKELVQLSYNSAQIARVLQKHSHLVQSDHLSIALDSYESTLDGHLACELLIYAWLKHHSAEQMSLVLVTKVTARFGDKPILY